MATKTLFTTEQVASIFSVSRARLYRALDRDWVQPDCVAGPGKMVFYPLPPGSLGQVVAGTNYEKIARARRIYKDVRARISHA